MASGAPVAIEPAGILNRETSSSGERFLWLMLAVGIVAPWWLPLSSQPIATFYKEWLVVVAFAFGGLLAAPLALAGGTRNRPHPLLLAAAACIAVLLVEAFAYEGAWRRSALMGFAAAFFAYMVVYGRSLRQRRGDAALVWIATCILVAALGSCVFAVLQVALPGLPGVLPRVGPKLFGNVGQANHFADLLWIGCVAAAFLHARGSLRMRSAVPLVVAMLALSTTSSSRAAWLYAAALAAFGALCWTRRPREKQTRRFGAALVGVVALYVVVTSIVSFSGVLDALGIFTAEERAASGAAAESTSQRLWFWRVGAEAVLDHPLLGVGAGRFPGEGVALAMRSAEIPKAAADAQAHNFFLQIAAECGAPLALFIAACLVLWLVRAWRSSADHPGAAVAIAMAIPILVHANLEHPLGYLYFLALLGLLVGQVAPSAGVAAEDEVVRLSPDLLRYASFAVLAAAAIGYLQYAQVERAMQSVVAQMRTGAPPQPSQELDARLKAVSSWSVFGDYAELIALLSALPTEANAKGLAQRCERALAFGPSAELLARCATVFQVDKQPARASYFADSLCKIYPTYVGVLIQSMSFVDQFSPTVEDLRSTCVKRAP